MRGLAIEHDPTGHAALVGSCLRDRGVDLEMFRVVENGADPVSNRAFPDPAGFDLIVVLGAIWSVYDTDTIGSWIGREVDFVRRAHDGGRPTLGICFGGQVLSTALGGTVSRSPVPEIGWYTLESDRPEDLSPGPWFQWHYDRFTVPDGATEIARNEVGPQAFCAGRSLGLQFHPELDGPLLEEWLEMGSHLLDGEGIDGEALAAQTAEIAPAVMLRTRRLVDWFLEDFAGR